MASFWRLASRTSLPVAAAFVSKSNVFSSKCEAEPRLQRSTEQQAAESSTVPTIPPKPEVGMRPHEEGDYNELFPKRQLWQPHLEYPMWHSNWDGLEPPSTGDRDEDRRRMRHIRKTGTTRHIILIRHGQYDETHKEDGKRVLTPLGREQAELTGKRLAEMLKGAQEDFGPCNIKYLRVSNMTRAQETAEIISKYLPGVEFADPDPMLNEGRPCHHIPGGKVSEKIIKTTDENHPRIEAAFRKHFHRKPYMEESNPDSENADPQAPPKERHEFEIIVCHANVIRYFLMRALQLPPEAWLRLCPFNCSLTYVTIRSTGTVSCRMLGDIGHLPYDRSTFSLHHGYNW